MNALPSFVTILFDTGILVKGVGVSDIEALSELLSGYGIEVTPEGASLLLRHLDLLENKNKSMNLTRVAPGADAQVVHVLDSLLPLPHLRELLYGKSVAFVDIGTGGGFPGVPLGCVTDWSGTLIDSVSKKASAVQEFVEALGIDKRIRSLHVRAEDLAREHGGSFNLMVTRAVAQTNVLLEYASPLLCENGIAAIYKARPSEDELVAAQRAAKLCGMSLVSRETFELPDNAGHREVLYYMKTGKAALCLPRRTGLASKEPLGL